MTEQPATAVLGDYALTRGIDATPRDLALWASAQPGPLGALGVEALGETAAPFEGTGLAWGSRTNLSFAWSRTRLHVLGVSNCGPHRRTYSSTSARSYGNGSWSMSSSRSYWWGDCPATSRSGSRRRQ